MARVLSLGRRVKPPQRPVQFVNLEDQIEPRNIRIGQWCGNDSRTRFVMSHVAYLTWLEGGYQIDQHRLAAIPAPRPFATQRSAGHWSTCAVRSPQSKGRPWPPVAAAY